MSIDVVRIKPLHYMHIKDTNTNVVKMICDKPKFPLFENLQVVVKPTKMILIPPGHYCVIENPVQKKTIKSKQGEITEIIEEDENGSAIVKYGCKEIRYTQPPFPLYDGEISLGVKPLTILPENQAFLLVADISFYDEQAKVERRTGDRWHFLGPATYYPRVEVSVQQVKQAVLLRRDEAILLTAIMNCVDVNNVKRAQGESWMIKGIDGAYMPGVNEKFEQKITPVIIQANVAIHFLALTDHIDYQSGVPRKAGDEWLVDRTMMPSYLPDVLNCKIVTQLNLTVLFSGDYCFIMNPYNNELRHPEWGVKKLISGPASFYLQPYEELMEVSRMILSETEALSLVATQDTKDSNNINRKAGEQWMLCGPTEFVPSLGIIAEKPINAFISIELLNLYFFSIGPFLFNLFLFLIILFSVFSFDSFYVLPFIIIFASMVYNPKARILDQLLN